MKKIVITLLIAIFAVTIIYAQKYAYVDTEYILENIPEYKDAQDQIDELAGEYQKEIEEKFAEIDKMYKTYQAEAVLMPEDIQKKKEEEIIAKENEVRELQKQRFGKDGDLFLKREELVKPIQEKIFNSIEEIATNKNYAFVFDKAGSLTILYVKPKFDISDDVLDDVGAELGTVRREDRVKKEYISSPDNNKTNPNNNKSDRIGKSPRAPGGMSPGPIKKTERK